MRVDIWSDVVCPWCYIGKRRFEAATATFEHRDELEVVWHSFELDPEAPPTQEGAYVAPLAAKFNRTEAEVETMLGDMTRRAAADGLDYHFDIAHHANTFDAHRLLHLAAERGVQGQLKEALFRAVFTEGRTVSDPTDLHDLAVRAGLDGDEVDDVLQGNRYTDDVRQDQAQASAYGITGVPFFVIDGKYGVSGAQPSEVLGQALEQAWAKSSDAPVQR